jgi:hypothetical protein
MGFIDLTRASNDLRQKNMSGEILNEIGRKLPKKVRKKLRWKKITPILGVLITLLVHLNNAFSGERKSSPSVKRRHRSALPQVEFRDDTLQAYVSKARAYQVEIDQLAQNSTGAANHRQTRELAAHLQPWTASIVDLAQRIENFRQNNLISRDLEEVPRSIASLDERLAVETDPAIRIELERALTSRRQQLAALEKLQRNIQMAEVKIENTISILGTIYSQILAGQSTEHIARHRRLLTQIDEEVLALKDHLEALEEVKMSRL